MEITFHKSFVILQLVHNSEFLERTQLFTQKLLTQVYVAPRLKLLLQKCYGRHHDLVERYKYQYLKQQWIFSFLRRRFLSSLTDRAFFGLAGTAYSPQAHKFTKNSLLWGPCCSS